MVVKLFVRWPVCILVLGALALTLGSAAQAEDQDQPLPQTENKTPATTIPASDVDDILTNANLRALSGSKSRWSLSNSITYDGGTVGVPFGEGRPNIANASATSIDTDINDTISLKYSLNAVDSLLFGIGIRKMAPFTGKGPSSDFYASGGKDVDLFDPSLTFQHVYKFFGIQAVATLGFTQFTRQDIHSADDGNLDKNLTFDQENVYELGDWSLGASAGFGGSLPTDPNVDYSQVQFWVDPYVEYKFNDTFNFRTVASMLSYEIYKVGHLVQDTYTQSIGLGISITRDIYLYPNIQFPPEHIAADYTNVGLTATINLF